MIRRLLALSLPLVLAACAGAPVLQQEDLPAARAAANALKVLGTRYQYGGADPLSGFDCSGLVQFSFREAGVRVPRTTEEQRLASRPILRAELRAGDLLFFDLESKKNSHVGIYQGDGTFVHAPSTGKDVRRDRLDAPYWARHLSETRRLSL